MLGFWIYDIVKEDQVPNEDLFKSKGRVEVLIGELSEKDVKIGYLQVKLDSINQLLSVKPKERVVIKKRYYEKVNNITNISIDSSVSILSRRLSEVSINR